MENNTFRHSVSVLENIKSLSTSMQDFFAITLNEGNVGTYLEIGGSKSQTNLLDILNWNGMMISSDFAGDKINFIFENPLTFNWKTLPKSIIKNKNIINTLILNTSNDEDVCSILDNLFSSDLKFDIIISKTENNKNQKRKILHYKKYLAIAINLTDTHNNCYDLWCDPKRIKFNTMIKFGYDNVSVEDLIYDVDLSKNLKRTLIYSTVVGEDKWAKHFLQYD